MNTEENQPNATQDNSLYSLYVSIPRFVSDQDQARNPTSITRAFIFEEQEYGVVLHPALLSTPAGATHPVYLGSLAALIENHLHRLATDSTAADPAPSRQLTTTLGQIQASIGEANTAVTRADIRQALEFLSLARIELTSDGDQSVLVITPISHLNMISLMNADDLQVRLQFNPLVALPD
jgi:hypothetical protein